MNFTPSKVASCASLSGGGNGWSETGASRTISLPRWSARAAVRPSCFRSRSDCLRMMVSSFAIMVSCRLSILGT